MEIKQTRINCWNSNCKFNYVDDSETGTRTCGLGAVFISKEGTCMSAKPFGLSDNGEGKE